MSEQKTADRTVWWVLAAFFIGWMGGASVEYFLAEDRHRGWLIDHGYGRYEYDDKTGKRWFIELTPEKKQ